MIRRIAVCLMAFSLTALIAAAADDPKPDEPPVELKKKKKQDGPDDKKPAPKAKDADPKKDGEPKKDDDPKAEPPPAAEDEKQVLERINKNMKASEDRLKNKDPGDSTRQIQKDIVKDLDSLIKQTQQQQDQNQPMGSGGASSSNPKNQQAGNKSSRPKRSPSKSSESKPDQGTQAKQGTNPANQGGAGKASSGDMSKLADLYKDRWGELPESLRFELDVYAREQFMAKYSELLKQYYSTIAERRREGEK